MVDTCAIYDKDIIKSNIRVSRVWYFTEAMEVIAPMPHGNALVLLKCASRKFKFLIGCPL